MRTSATANADRKSEVLREERQVRSDGIRERRDGG